MIVCDICGKKLEDTEHENFISLGEHIFYTDICSDCLTSINNFIQNKRGENK